MSYLFWFLKVNHDFSEFWLICLVFVNQKTTLKSGSRLKSIWTKMFISVELKTLGLVRYVNLFLCFLHSTAWGKSAACATVDRVAAIIFYWLLLKWSSTLGLLIIASHHSSFMLLSDKHSKHWIILQINTRST